jgi:hypothetical protein
MDYRWRGERDSRFFDDEKETEAAKMADGFVERRPRPVMCAQQRTHFPLDREKGYAVLGPGGKPVV